MNTIPRSVIISCGNPCSFHAPCQQSAQTCSVVSFSVLRMKCAIPEYRSTITRIASRLLTGGSFMMWSIATNFQIFCGHLWCRHNRKAWTTVQAFLTTGWTTRTMTSLMTLTHTWSMAKDTRTGWHSKMPFMDSGAATQLTCGITYTMTQDDS